MKKLFLLLACVAMSVLAMGQDNQLVWANGRLLYGTPVESIDSLTYDEMQDIDTLHLLLPRTLIKVVHDTVYIHDTVYVETDCGGEDDTPSAGISVFSVSADRQVTFSKGNLQYHPANDEWRFAENQTDYIGDANSNIAADYDGWIDLFGWSTIATNFGVSTSTNNSDYLGSVVDWGANKIGNDAPNTWRTLTYNEWEYLLNNRPNASSLKGVTQVNGVNGLILLPDNWTCPAGVTFKSGFHSSEGVDYYAAYQTFTAAEWSKLEAAGAVFLPASGYRYGSNVYGVRNYGNYWSATEGISNGVGSLNFYSDGASVGNYNRYCGRSVRFVKDIEGGGTTPDTPDTPTEPEEPDTPTEPEEPTNPSAGIGVFSVSADKQVTFSKGNLQYTQSTNTWSFADNQWDYIGTDNVTGGSVSSDPTSGDKKSGDALADKVDLFGWSTATMNFGVSTSTSNSVYRGSFVDWGTNQIGNDAPNTWRTLTLDEWGYVVYNRQNASSLQGVAQVNGVNGLILLPDNWVCPEGVTFKSGFHNNGVDYYAAYQTFTAAEWSKLEAAGAVFLPAAGGRRGSYVNGVQFFGHYGSATESGSTWSYYLYFGSGGASMFNGYRDGGESVRLVKDIEGGGATPDTPDTPVEPEEPDTPTEPEEPTNPSAGIGTFSVSSDKQVTFSKGNLQYTQSTNTWSFAENQWDYIGTDNVTGGDVTSDPTYGDTKSGTALADKVDLFGWSTSATIFGASTSTFDSDYSGSFVDWGTNKIGNDDPNTWRTLTYDEWEYLLDTRPNASSLKGVAQVNGVNGLILLPDNWTCPAGVTFKSGFHNNYGVEYYAAYQTFTAAEWSKLEAAGAVFLPASGNRGDSNVYSVQDIGFYWSATGDDSDYAYCLGFYSDRASMDGHGRSFGHSVRLVKDL